MKIHLSDKFGYGRLLRYALPSVLMMIFTSIYGVVDGFFVSNFVGKTPFAAVNLIMPFLMIMGGIGFMFGTGGCALIAKTLGEGDRDKANRLFSMVVYVSAAVGIVLGAAGIAAIRPIAKLLGADADMIDTCVVYGRVILAALPFAMLQFEFQSFFATAEKPKLGLIVTLAAGITNMIGDALFVAVFKWGVVGAAAATVAGYIVGGGVPLVYFFCRNGSLLRLGKTRFYGRALGRVCGNGSSELLSNISASVVSILYNAQLMRIAGEDGVAAYGVLMYVNFFFLAMFIGYTVGTTPIISYHYGAATDQLKSILNKSLVIIGVLSVLMLGAGQGLAWPLAKLFVGYDAGLLDMTVRGFRFFSFSFLFAGIAVYGSAFFTALNNGLISAIISFLRTLVFQTVAVYVFPIFFKLDGIWVSLVAAELVAAAVTVTLLCVFRKKYRY